MNLLAVESATETVSVALSVNGKVMERYRHAPRLHAELLLPCAGNDTVSPSRVLDYPRSSTFA